MNTSPKMKQLKPGQFIPCMPRIHSVYPYSFNSTTQSWGPRVYVVESMSKLMSGRSSSPLQSLFTWIPSNNGLTMAMGPMAKEVPESITALVPVVATFLEPQAAPVKLRDQYFCSITECFPTYLYPSVSNPGITMQLLSGLECRQKEKLLSVKFERSMKVSRLSVEIVLQPRPMIPDIWDQLMP